MEQIIEVEKLVLHQNNIKFTKFGAYKTQKLKTFENELFYKLKNSSEFKNDQAKKLEINFIFSPKTKKQFNFPKLTRPDLDNLSKTFLDILEKKYDFDDKTIVDLSLKKYYGNDLKQKNIKIYIKIENML